MGEREFITEMEKLFEAHPMRRKVVDRIIGRIASMTFITMPEGDHASINLDRIDGMYDITLNVLSQEMEVSFAHELAHAYYGRSVSGLFKKRYDDNGPWKYRFACEEDLIDMAAKRFCQENPGYLKNFLEDVLTGRAYNQIETSFYFGHFPPRCEALTAGIKAGK